LGSVAVARDDEADGKIVGLLGLVPSRVSCRGKILEADVAIDLVVDRAYRGRGIFMGLGRTALEGSRRRGAEIVWGFPNQAAAHAWFDRFNWVNMGPVPLMIRPLRSGFFLRRIARWLGKVDFEMIAAPAFDDAVSELSAFGPESEKLLGAFAERARCSAVRDARWLNWRLFQHPTKTYRTIAALDSDAKMCAFVTSKTERNNGEQILHIMEAISRRPSDDPALTRLLRRELSLAASNGAGAAMSWCRPQSPNYRAYRRAGFLPFPARLRPRMSYFGARVFGDLPSPIECQQWYISYLDLDIA
jgi:hypothetical protein